MLKKAAVLLCACVASGVFSQAPLVYPKARCGDQVDSFHGTLVRDPFRWLENTESEETRAWIDAQVKLTSDYLARIPVREKIKKRLTEVWNYERYGLPYKIANFYIYKKNNGLQNQDILYRAESLNGPSTVFFDPNQLSSDGTVTLGASAFTEDGKLWAYSVTSAGSDRVEWKIKNLANGQHLKDALPLNRYTSFSWVKDGSGFFYGRFPETEKGSELKVATRFPKIYFHKLGDDLTKDTLVYERPEDGELTMDATVTDDGKWLMITTTRGTEEANEVAFKDLSKPGSPVVSLVGTRTNTYTFIGNDAATFYFVTDKDAPLGKVVKVNVLAKNRKWVDVIVQAKQTLRAASYIRSQLFLNYLTDAHSQIKVFSPNGKFVKEISLPGLGTADGFYAKRNEKETFYNYTSYNAAPVIYHYDVVSGKSSIFKKTTLSIDESQFVVKQEFFTSKDGTRVPMLIVHKKDIVLDGSNPTILYGYGGFHVSLTPAFSPSQMVWLEMGGVYVVANLRGGSEYGTAWWEGGSRLNKQNVFDDFIAAAEWLIKNKYTSTRKLGIYGRSNGGLLVGAVVNQRPDLFGAAVAGVGVMDMLRFDQFTIGYMWKSDYGSTADAADFKAMYAYSPYHNVQCRTHYPAMLVTTADHDDRVFPGHSFKYAAAMQAAQAGGAPVLIRIETKAGHGAGKPTTKVIGENADMYSFLWKNLGMH